MVIEMRELLCSFQLCESKAVPAETDRICSLKTEVRKGLGFKAVKQGIKTSRDVLFVTYSATARIYRP